MQKLCDQLSSQRGKEVELVRFSSSSSLHFIKPYE